MNTDPHEHLLRGITSTYIANCERYKCRVLSSITKTFSEADRAVTAPTVLDFSAEYIGNDGVRALLWTIKERLPHLKVLSLLSCGVEEGAVEDMALAFKGNPYLQEIDLRKNNLYASSGRALIALLRSNPKLYKLSVDTHEMPERVEMALQKAEKRNYDACFPPPPPPPEVDKYQTRERLDALLNELEFLRDEAEGGGASTTAVAGLSTINSSASTFANTVTKRTDITDAANKVAVTLAPAASHNDQRLVTSLRLMHYWNLRLGSFGVQYVLDHGLDMPTMRELIDIEKRARVVEGLADVRAVAPFRDPLDLVQVELNAIGKALEDPDSLLSQLSALREGGTISMQFNTCRTLLEEIFKQGSHQAPIELLMVTLHRLRMGIAAGTLRDYADTVLGPMPAVLPTSPSSPRRSSPASPRSRVAYSTSDASATTEYSESAIAWATKCRAFEEDLMDVAKHLAGTTYESTRQLSLVCDEMRYFGINNRGFLDGVLARGATMTRKATTSPAEREDEGGDLTAFAVELYSELLGEPSHSLHAQRKGLLDRLADLLTSDMNAYLAHYEEARAHQGGIRERFPEEWAAVASYLHPFLVWEAPPVDPYKEFAIPALPDRPRPTRIADELAGLSNKIVTGPTGSGVGSSNDNSHILTSPAASDVFSMFGAITDKAMLLKWFRQFAGHARYTMILSLGKGKDDK